MKIASSALASSPMTAVFPLFPFILSCLVLGVFIVAFFSLHTMPLELDNPSMQWLSDNVVAFKLTLLFCCVWHICFLTGLQKVFSRFDTWHFFVLWVNKHLYFKDSDHFAFNDLVWFKLSANKFFRSLLLGLMPSIIGTGHPPWHRVFIVLFVIILVQLVSVHL